MGCHRRFLVTAASVAANASGAAVIINRFIILDVLITTRISSFRDDVIINRFIILDVLVTTRR